MFLPPGSASSTTLIVKRPLSKNGAQRPRESQKIHRPRPRVRPMQPRGRNYSADMREMGAEAMDG
jgi:hypothetical protein